jgi:hypothetical protein
LEVVTLDLLLQVLGDIVQRRARQVASLPRRLNVGRVGASGIGTDPIRGEQGLILQHLAESPPGRIQIPLGGEQEVHKRTLLVDGAVEVPALSPGLEPKQISFIALAPLAQKFLSCKMLSYSQRAAELTGSAHACASFAAQRIR